MKPRHLSEGLLPEDKHPSSGDYWTDNISEVYFSVWEGTLLLLHCVCPRCLWILLSDVQPLVRLVYRIVYFERLPIAIISISTDNSLLKHPKFQMERCRKVKDEATSEGVSSMRKRLIDFKAQLTIQGNELRGLRDDFRGCPMISSWDLALRDITEMHQAKIALWVA
ncbi:hypothetical protein PIB30_098502 [Stylosanthes scabra]|uniref:Uncharacterized protein n=1 Tax=Stylosanthes scabra TaxID=79078 RepID=A0ABU6UVH9_9FABA|nr:hypothetical protein [Stylosanthes scabra]